MQESYVIYHRNISFLFSKVNGHFLAKLLALPFSLFGGGHIHTGHIQHLREEFKKERGAVYLPEDSSRQVGGKHIFPYSFASQVIYLPDQTSQTTAGLIERDM